MAETFYQLINKAYRKDIKCNNCYKTYWKYEIAREKCPKLPVYLNRYYLHSLCITTYLTWKWTTPSELHKRIPMKQSLVN